MTEPMKAVTKHNGAEYNLATGLDWDRLRAEWRAAASPEELAVKPREAAPGQVSSNVPAKRAIPQSERAMPNAIPIAKRRQIIELYQNGGTVPAISGVYGVSTITVRKILTNAGIYDPTRDRSRVNANRGQKETEEA